jgi:hypothetical protein
MHVKALIGKQWLCVVCPLDQAHAIAIEQFFQSDALQLRQSLNTVQIGVINRQIATLCTGAILIDQNETWAVDRIGRSQPKNDPLDQMSLSRPQVATQRHNIAALQQFPQALPDTNGLCNAV